MAQIGAEDFTVNEIHSDWQAPGFDLAASTRVAATQDGEIVGYVEVWDGYNPPVNVNVWGRVHPEYEGLGIGTALQTWAHTRARQAIDRVPEGARVAVRSTTISTGQAAKDLLEEMGMALIRHSYRMTIDLEGPQPQPAWPEGITLRTCDPQADLEAVARANHEAFRDHFGWIDSPLEENLKRWQHWIESDEHFDPRLWFLAMDGEEIAGLCLCRPQAYEDPDAGYINSLGVLRPWRRRGLGLALLQHAFGQFRQRGKLRAGLGVDAENLTGALSLYERAGMRVHRRYDTYEKVLRDGYDLSTQTLEN
jgi:mycothiol synthase